MSIELLCWAFRQELPCAEKFVLVALADMADMDGKCWPSQALLAKRCGIARETVNRQIRMLANAGMIRIERRVNGHGQQASLYFVRCDAGSQPHVIDDHTPVTDDHTEPSIEPSEVESPDGDSPPPIAPPRVLESANGRSRGSRLAADWQPCAEDIAFAVGCGLDPGWIAGEFADYWHAVAGSKGVKLDWCATWRNWCRREMARPSVHGRGHGLGDSKIVAALSRVRFASDREGDY